MSPSSPSSPSPSSSSPAPALSESVEEMLQNIEFPCNEEGDGETEREEGERGSEGEGGRGKDVSGEERNPLQTSNDIGYSHEVSNYGGMIA